jgi:hypothetical protein
VKEENSMTATTYTASVFSEETQQEVKVIVYENEYASIEVPTTEVMFNREQLRQLGMACLSMSDMLTARRA